MLVLILNLPPPRSTLFPYTTLFRSHPLAELPGVLPHRDPAGLDLGPGIEAHLEARAGGERRRAFEDRKSTRLNSSHLVISYAVFCLEKKNYIKYILLYTSMLSHCSD